MQLLYTINSSVRVSYNSLDNIKAAEAIIPSNRRASNRRASGCRNYSEQSSERAIGC